MTDDRITLHRDSEGNPVVRDRRTGWAVVFKGDDIELLSTPTGNRITVDTEHESVALDGALASAELEHMGDGWHVIVGSGIEGCEEPRVLVASFDDLGDVVRLAPGPDVIEVAVDSPGEADPLAWRVIRPGQRAQGGQ